MFALVRRKACVTARQILEIDPLEMHLQAGSVSLPKSGCMLGLPVDV